MLTPQDLQEVAFEKAKIGGYVMKSVDDFLETLLDDYVTLYKENAVLKSKMRLLVERLEEYRAKEAETKAAAEEAQRTCDRMIEEARRHSDEIVNKARQSASDLSRNADSAVLAENERLSRAKAATAEFVAAVEAQLTRQQTLLENLKAMELPAAGPVRRAYDYEAESAPRRTGDIAAQIEKSVDRATESYPAPDPKAATRVMPALDLDKLDASKFDNLQFGKNYRPND